MNTQVLAAFALGVVSPVVAALLVRLLGKPGVRLWVRPGLSVSLMSALGCAWAYTMLFPVDTTVLLGACAAGLTVSLAVCLALLRHRIRACRLFAREEWSGDDAVDVMKAIIRYYRDPARDFKVQMWLVTNNGPRKPDELELSIVDGRSWRRPADVGWSADMFEHVVRAVVGQRTVSAAQSWLRGVAVRMEGARKLLAKGVTQEDVFSRVDALDTSVRPPATWAQITWKPKARRPEVSYDDAVLTAV